MEGALARYGAVAPLLETRFAALDLQRSAAQVSRLLDAPSAGRAIALVGTFAAMAWYEAFEGRDTLFFALEMLDFDAYGALPAIHELAHLTQLGQHDEPWPDAVVGLELLREGLAVAVTRRLLPDAPLSLHFAVADHDAWAAACAADRPAIERKLLDVLDLPSLAQHQRFFWPEWGRETRDVPACVGYLVGAWIVEDLLAAGHTLPELTRWPAGRVLAEVRTALTA